MRIEDVVEALVKEYGPIDLIDIVSKIIKKLPQEEQENAFEEIEGISGSGEDLAKRLSTRQDFVDIFSELLSITVKRGIWSNSFLNSLNNGEEGDLLGILLRYFSGEWENVSEEFWRANPISLIEFLFSMIREEMDNGELSNRSLEKETVKSKLERIAICLIDYLKENGKLVGVSTKVEDVRDRKERPVEFLRQVLRS